MKMRRQKNPRVFPDRYSALRLDHEKKPLPCLGCGKLIMTDRCHRFCKECSALNNGPRVRVPKVVPLNLRDL
ncbi:MAG: hypothetical protein QF473_25775 [Planctomycetota bacterium]|jgi:hypothetical protein|nr:hypothetical protein [Planctomycetota bacterium]